MCVWEVPFFSPAPCMNWFRTPEGVCGLSFPLLPAIFFPKHITCLVCSVFFKNMSSLQAHLFCSNRRLWFSFRASCVCFFGFQITSSQSMPVTRKVRNTENPGYDQLSPSHGGTGSVQDHKSSSSPSSPSSSLSSPRLSPSSPGGGKEVVHKVHQFDRHTMDYEVFRFVGRRFCLCFISVQRFVVLAGERKTSRQQGISVTGKRRLFRT